MNLRKASVGLIGFALLLSVHTAFADTGGPNTPASAANDSSTGAGTISWSTITAPFAIDGTSSASVSLASTRTTKYLKFTNLGFALPTNATIDGITVTLARRTTVVDVVRDSVVALVATNATTTSKADTSVFWPTAFASKSYGGAADTWGRTWTASEINSSSFGVIVSAENTDAVSSRTVHIDGVSVAVTYSIPVVTHTLSYTAGGNGSITGTALQTVNDGADGLPVTAVADSGFHFVDWSDASTNNPRTDASVTADIGVTARFEADAPIPDTTPDQFTFADQTGVALNSEIISNGIIVIGINTSADISVTGGEYSINGNAYTPLVGTVSNGDQIAVRHTSSGSRGGTVETTLTIGGVSDTFTTAASFESSSGGGSRRRSRKPVVPDLPALGLPTVEETVAATLTTPTNTAIKAQIAELRAQVLTLLYQLVVSLQAQLAARQ